jgi:thiol-disulfide isomerase/thioredoxin
VSPRVVGIVGAVFALIALSAIAVALVRPGAGDAIPNASSSPRPPLETPAAGSDSDSATIHGIYVEYADDDANAEGRILLFFHAPWCPQCRSIESDILAEGVPDGVTIVKVDYDSRQDVRQRYGVTLQTTFVEVDATGAELEQHVAYDDPHLDAVLAAMREPR